MDCWTGKHGFATKDEAWRRIRIHRDGSMEPYRCDCGRWHVGHREFTEKRRRWRRRRGKRW